jgi:hypothetical protein
LLAWEDAAVGLRLSAADGLGRWSPTGAWQSYGDQYSEWEARASVWAIVRLSERWQLSGQLPWIVNYRQAGEQSAFGTGAGDAQVSGRYELIGMGKYLHVPALALSVTALAPLSRREEASSAPLGADATGRGVWECSASITIEQTWSPWFVRVESGGRASLPFTRHDLNMRQRYGPGFTVALSGGVEIRTRIVLGLLVQRDWEGRFTLGGADVDGSASSAWLTSAAVSWKFDPHWMLQGAVSSNVFASNGGVNRPGQLSTTMGIRHGYF